MPQNVKIIMKRSELFTKFSHEMKIT